MKTTLLVAVLAAAAGFASTAAPLDTSTFTEVIKEVSTLPAAGSTATPARVNDVLKAPDRVRTGPESRAELTAPDQTITRVGANTVFSFESGGRTLNLEQGNLLFHAPKGIGGGIIKSVGAAAAVLGTTLIASATPDGGFKVIFLEGKGTVTLANGSKVGLKAGQLVYVRPGDKGFGPVLSINLAKLVAGSQLVGGFPDQLASLPLIQQAIQLQQKQIASGQVADTGVSADTYVQLPAAGNGFGGLDSGTYQTVVHPQVSNSESPTSGNGPGNNGGTGAP
jgi:hypothetical protein